MADEKVILEGQDGVDDILTADNDKSTEILGKGGNDSLTGGAEADTLNGGAGVDTMKGGKGDDIYIVDNAGDMVTEEADQGTDTVESSITWTLGDNVENLTLTGGDAINGTGNDLNNVIQGNDGDNTISGGASGLNVLNGNGGNDDLTGGSSWDQLWGGDGNDTR